MKKFIITLLILSIPIIAFAEFSTGGVKQRLIDADDNEISIDTDGSIYVQGPTANDSASTDQPVPIGGIAESTVPTAVADADAVKAWFDTFGKLLIYGANQSVGAVDVNPVAQEPIGSGSIVLIDETLDNSPTTSTSSAVFVGDKRSLTLLIKTVETSSADDSEWNLLVEASPDNSVWIDMKQLVVASAVTERRTYTSNDEESVYIPIDFTGQYIRVIAEGITTDASDYHAVDVYLQYQK